MLQGLNVEIPVLCALGFTRSARWVSDSVNVPRFGVPPNLLRDFTASDTQRTLLSDLGGLFRKLSHLGTAATQRTLLVAVGVIV